ncbi:MAG: hypothetical protein Q8N26_36305 [Myxococcales bacterium]|nr:hypothetical protein [Myxococcales bacterium]
MHVMAMVAVVMSAGPVEPKSGTYIFEGGIGELVLGKGRFEINVVGANAHVCQVGGVWKGATGVANEEGEKCELTFVVTGDSIAVTSVGGETCRSYCGARASFDGKYLTPPKGCTRKELKQTRAAFKKLYDAKKFAEAVTTLAPLVTTCEPVVDRFARFWIRNDLAIAQHHAGDDAACLVTLEPLAEYRDAPPGEPVGYEPSFADEFAKIAKATRTNAQRCGFVWKK